MICLATHISKIRKMTCCMVLLISCAWLYGMSAPLPTPEDERKDISSDYIDSASPTYNFALASDGIMGQGKVKENKPILSPTDIATRDGGDEKSGKLIPKASRFKIVKIIKCIRYPLLDGEAEQKGGEGGVDISFIITIEIDNPAKDQCELNAAFIDKASKPSLNKALLLDGDGSLKQRKRSWLSGVL